MPTEKKNILSAALRVEPLYIEQWGFTVYVRELTAIDRQAIEGAEFSRTLIAARCLVTRDGHPLFNDEDIEEIGTKSAVAIDRISALALSISGLSEKYIESKIEHLLEPTALKFYFRLCLAVGYSHPRKMLAEMSSRDIGDWLAYNVIEPCGDERQGHRIGVVAAIQANQNRKKGARAFTVKDFFPRYGDDRKPKQTTEDHKNILMAIVEETKGKGKANGS